MKAIITVSDLHVGSSAGLCSPNARQDGGGHYSMNKFQWMLWHNWLDFWDNFIPQEIQGAEKVVIVLNGDLLEGLHHNMVGLWTNNIQTQRTEAVEILYPLTGLGDIYVVRGTEAHSGPGSQEDEEIGKQLKAKPNEVDDYSVWQLWLDLDGVVFQFAHHIGVTSSAAYETSAPMREMIAGMIEAEQWGRRVPDVFVRSHRHRFVHVSIPSVRYEVKQAVITPGWQLRTPNVERIDRMRMPHIGGVVFKVEDDKCQIKKILYPLPDPEPIKI